MLTRVARQAAPRRWYTAGLIATFNLLLLAWLVRKPGSHAVFVAVDNVAQFVGPLLVVPLCFLGGRRGDRPRVRTMQQWAPCLLGLGALSYAGGQIIYTIYEQVLHYPSVPFPSWADAVYLCTYPVLLLGILLLPGRRLPMASRVRILLDGLMIMTAVLTFSWYFILGPTIAQGGQTPLASGVGLAYPLGDLVLIACLLVLWSRLEEPELRRGPAALHALRRQGWPVRYRRVGRGPAADRDHRAAPGVHHSGEPTPLCAAGRRLHRAGARVGPE